MICEKKPQDAKDANAHCCRKNFGTSWIVSVMFFGICWIKKNIKERIILIIIMHIIILKEKNETNAMQGIIPYGMIPCRTFVSLFFFNSTSDVVPIILYIAKMISYSNTHVKSENQNIKRTMETKSIYSIFVFE